MTGSCGWGQRRYLGLLIWCEGIKLFKLSLFIISEIFRFRELGKRVFYVTNNSTKHRREYKTKVDKLGFGGDLVTKYLLAIIVHLY